jgi:hypothetical protein
VPVCFPVAREQALVIAEQVAASDAAEQAWASAALSLVSEAVNAAPGLQYDAVQLAWYAVQPA